MKAITCTQCGALINRTSFGNKLAFCDYCGAKLLLDEPSAKPVEIPQIPRNDWQENASYRNYAETDAPEYVPLEDKSPVRTLMNVLFLIAIPIIIFVTAGRSCLNRPSESSKKTVAASNTPAFRSTPFPTVAPTVYPNINYTVTVKWDGSDDMEHFEVPSIDQTKLPTSDIKELKKTIFANRSVQVRVTIDENGEVSEAKAISGHPLLKEASEIAARKSLFSNRSKPTSRLLNYFFHITVE
ncbi:MAG TPA: hypothetical protein VGC76_18570 [Pyrinomonadaceae bacterium]|jgi:hypothetical protein